MKQAVWYWRRKKSSKPKSPNFDIRNNLGRSRDLSWNIVFWFHDYTSFFVKWALQKENFWLHFTLIIHTEMKCKTVHMCYVWPWGFMRFSTQFSFEFWIKFNFLQKFSESNRWFPGDTSKYLCGDIMWRGLLTQFTIRK